MKTTKLIASFLLIGTIGMAQQNVSYMNPSSPKVIVCTIDANGEVVTFNPDLMDSLNSLHHQPGNNPMVNHHNETPEMQKQLVDRYGILSYLRLNKTGFNNDVEGKEIAKFLDNNWYGYKTATENWLRNTGNTHITPNDISKALKAKEYKKDVTHRKFLAFNMGQHGDGDYVKTPIFYDYDRWDVVNPTLVFNNLKSRSGRPLALAYVCSNWFEFMPLQKYQPTTGGGITDSGDDSDLPPNNDNGNGGNNGGNLNRNIQDGNGKCFREWNPACLIKVFLDINQACGDPLYLTEIRDANNDLIFKGVTDKDGYVKYYYQEYLANENIVQGERLYLRQEKYQVVLTPINMKGKPLTNENIKKAIKKTDMQITRDLDLRKVTLPTYVESLDVPIPGFELIVLEEGDIDVSVIGNNNFYYYAPLNNARLLPQGIDGVPNTLNPIMGHKLHIFVDDPQGLYRVIVSRPNNNGRDKYVSHDEINLAEECQLIISNVNKSKSQTGSNSHTQGSGNISYPFKLWIGSGLDHIKMTEFGGQILMNETQGTVINTATLTFLDTSGVSMIDSGFAFAVNNGVSGDQAQVGAFYMFDSTQTSPTDNFGLMYGSTKIANLPWEPNSKHNLIVKKVRNLYNIPIMLDLIQHKGKKFTTQIGGGVEYLLSQVDKTKISLDDEKNLYPEKSTSYVGKLRPIGYFFTGNDKFKAGMSFGKNRVGFGLEVYNALRVDLYPKFTEGKTNNYWGFSVKVNPGELYNLYQKL